MFFLIPVAAGLVAWRWHVNRKNKKAFTPERQAVYESAMHFVKDPTKLNKLADAYQKQGLATQATNLRSRANLPKTNPKIQAAYQNALKQGLVSTDPVAINALATAFEQKGAMNVASTLRQYAAGLKAADQVAPIHVSPPPAAPPPAAPEPEAPPNPTPEVPPT